MPVFAQSPSASAATSSAPWCFMPSAVVASGVDALATPLAAVGRSLAMTSLAGSTAGRVQSAEPQEFLSPASARVVSDSVYSHLEWKFNNRDKVILTLTLTEDQSVDISLYNILGKKIKEFEHSYMTECNRKELSYSLSDVPMGAYIVAGQGSSFRSALRIIVSDKD